MIILIAGASHTGKTLLAQRLLMQYHYPVLSLDLLKMGLIRSGRTPLTPMDSQTALTECLWPIAREMIKTAMENGQHLIVEGCYIPFDWKKDFSRAELENIRYLCLVMSKRYLCRNMADIFRYADTIEQRKFDDCEIKELIEDNRQALVQCKRRGLPYLLIDDRYTVDPKSVFENAFE